MWRRRLKPIRVAAALAVFGGLTVALVDFRDAVPAAIGHWLAAVQFVPAAVAAVTGAGLAGFVAVCVILVATLLFGRVYCAAVCPLGVLQDMIARLVRWTRRGPARLPAARPMNALRYGFLGLAVAGLAAGWGGLTLALLDPYSHYGRMAAGLFRPVLVLVNNAAVGLGEWWGVPLLYRVAPSWFGWGALALPLLMLILVGVLAGWRGRLFCNTVCPVGTLLGLVARRSAWRLAIDASACRKCGDCLMACKAQCIDLRAGTIDASRCIACCNCLGVCTENGIAHRFAWAAPARVVAPAAPVDSGRRAFLADAAVMAIAAAGAAPRLLADIGENTVADDDRCGGVCPPGAASVERLLNRCTACHLCISACPTQVLRPALLEYGVAGLLRPRLDYGRSFCNYDCRRCAEVCPDGALTPLDLSEKQVTRLGRAVFNEELCVVKTNGTDCAACSEHCPTKAVDTVPFRAGLRLPEVRPELCIGCGGCEFACPVVPKKAITVTGLRRHERATRAVDAKLATPPVNRDFPF